MNDIKSIRKSVNILKKSKTQFALLHCISEYPADTKRLNLDFINVLKKIFPNVVIGYSDHSLGIIPSISVSLSNLLDASVDKSKTFAPFRTTVGLK